MAEFRVTGLAELKKALNDLPERLERNVVRGGLRAGGNVIRDAAKARVPVRTGKLRDTIKVKTSARRGKLKATIVAGGQDVIYARMVELGTAAHFIKPRHRKSLLIAGLMREVVHHPGAQPKPFMRPALDESAEAAVNAFADYVRKRLAKEAAK